MRLTRKARSILKAIYGLVGLLGMIMAAYGINFATGGESTKTLGLVMLALGALFCTGGIIPLVYTLVCEFRAKLGIRIRHARLEHKKLAADRSEWRLMVEVVVTPPPGHSLVFQSDGIAATIAGLPGVPLEITSMGISPSSNPVIFDGAFAEITIARQMAVVIEGKTTLTANYPLSIPGTWDYTIALTDATGEWTNIRQSQLHPSGAGWAGLPDPA